MTPVMAFLTRTPFPWVSRADLGERNSHTVLNIAFMTPLMWDGRVMTLEEQSLLPFLSPSEFDLPPEQAVIKLRRQGYSDLFQQAFGEDVTVGNLQSLGGVSKESGSRRFAIRPIPLSKGCNRDLT